MKLLNFTPMQEHLLSQAAKKVGEELLSFNFQDPAQDQQSIRRHAYLSGKWELLNELLADEFPEQAPQDQPANPNPPAFI